MKMSNSIPGDHINISLNNGKESYMDSSIPSLPETMFQRTSPLHVALPHHCSLCLEVLTLILNIHSFVCTHSYLLPCDTLNVTRHFMALKKN